MNSNNYRITITETIIRKKNTESKMARAQKKIVKYCVESTT